jgi:hypothetical protein
MEQESLSELLNSEPTETEEVQETVTEVEPEQAETPQRNEAGRFTKTGETSGSPPQVEEPALDHAAIVAERRRRQEAEQRAQALEQQLQALQAPPPDMWEDTEGWQQHNRQETVAEAVAKATLNARYDMSEMMARQAHPDFEEAKAEFIALAEQNPAIAQQVLADPHPWNKAYQIAKNHRAMQELGTLDVEALKAKWREEFEAEQRTPTAARPVPTLSNERNVGSRSGPAWSAPTLSDLLR